MGKFLFNLPDDKLNELRKLSLDTNVAISDYLRQAVDIVLSSKISCGLVMSGSVCSGFVIVMRR